MDLKLAKLFLLVSMFNTLSRFAIFPFRSII